MLETLCLAAKAKIQTKTRVSLRAYVKGWKSIRLGNRCRIFDHVVLDAGRGSLTLGDQVVINRYALLQSGNGCLVLGHRVEINNHSIINATGGVEIGDDTIIGPGVRIISYSHPTCSGALIREQPLVRGSIRIGRGCWLGANVVILAGCEIGDGAVLGAGAVVTSSIPPNSIAIGVPARVLRQR